MRIATLIENAKAPFFSLEFFPPANTELLPNFYATAEKLGALGPLFMSVTYGAGGKKRDATLGVVSELAGRGYAAMAHLTCVGATPESISAFLADLKAKGVDNVLALRGDPPAGQDWNWDDGYFRRAVDLVKFIRAENSDMGIGVAAYPSPHPESPTFAADRRDLAAKLEAGADFAITQLFFDPREYEDLTARLRERGVRSPIIPGILPIQSFESLKRVLSLCGANIPGKFYLELEKANAKGGAERARETGVKFALRQIRTLLEAGAPGIHLYTLNKSSLCERIIRESGLI